LGICFFNYGVAHTVPSYGNFIEDRRMSG